MCAPEGFHYFINHVKQRLVVILDYNIRNGLDPCQSDISLLRELYDLFDKGSIDTFSQTEVAVTIQQLSFFGQIDSTSPVQTANPPTAQSLPLEVQKKQ
jgi:hypothetical protein